MEVVVVIEFEHEEPSNFSKERRMIYDASVPLPLPGDTVTNPAPGGNQPFSGTVLRRNFIYNPRGVSVRLILRPDVV